MNDELLTIIELAEKMKVTTKTIYNYRQRGMPFKRFGRSVRYNFDEVLNWFSNFEPVEGGEKE